MRSQRQHSQTCQQRVGWTRHQNQHANLKHGLRQGVANGTVSRHVCRQCDAADLLLPDKSPLKPPQRRKTQCEQLLDNHKTMAPKSPTKTKIHVSCSDFARALCCYVLLSPQKGNSPRALSSTTHPGNANHITMLSSGEGADASTVAAFSECQAPLEPQPNTRTS
jgi:hypothetical protein